MDIFAGNHEDDFVDLVPGCEEVASSFERNLRRLFHRIAIRATTDRWKCDRLDFAFNRDPERDAITIRECFCLPGASARPNPTHRLDHQTRRPIITAGDSGLA